MIRWLIAIAMVVSSAGASAQSHHGDQKEQPAAAKATAKPLATAKPVQAKAATAHAATPAAPPAHAPTPPAHTPVAAGNTPTAPPAAEHAPAGHDAAAAKPSTPAPTTTTTAATVVPHVVPGTKVTVTARAPRPVRPVRRMPPAAAAPRYVLQWLPERWLLTWPTEEDRVALVWPF